VKLLADAGIMVSVRLRLAGRQPLHALSIERELHEHPGVTFDASEMEFASPLDLAGLAAWAARLRHEGIPVALSQPADVGVRRYLTRMDLITILDQAGIKITGTVPVLRRANCADVLLELRRILGPGDAERFALDAYELVRRRTSDSSAAAAAKILGELLDNATTHADSPVGVYAAAQVHQRGGDVELAVADGGIGIPTHLARNPCFRHLTAAEALQAALKPGVTGTSEQRGNGLPDLLNTASSFGGQLILRSGDGYAQVMAASSDRQFATGDQVPGTWAWVHVRLPRGQRPMVSLQQ
jgi:hypothetical protein